MKKIKNEKGLLKEALRVGAKYGEVRGAVKFEASDSVQERVEYLYRLLVKDKLIQPLPEPEVSQKSMRHKLALWILKKLPEDHPLVRQESDE
mgnify:CR=1 FL=1